MKYFSAFSGIGGFELGIQKAYETDIFVRDGTTTITESEGVKQGLESASESYERGGDSPNNIIARSSREILCIGYSEIDRYATQIYQKHFPDHKNYGDITKINASELLDFDLFVGGFPCQAFSIAGKRLGFNDTRGTLFFDIARILKEKRPRNVVLENVKGLLSHDNGRTFKTIISTLVELGYGVEWQVLNAKNFGVPQNRERVFIVGHLGGEPTRKVFPLGEDGGATDDLHGHTANTLTARYEGAQATGNYIGEGERDAQETDGQSVLEDRIESDNSDIRGGQTHATNLRIRRLTPLECERLMGYPDGWTEGLSDTQRYKCLGNGIVSNVVAEVIKGIL